ncbi:hypothetical protein POL68_20665 [Stigmatella sp. ncwal1]|uniref:HEAT repeat domain-containing protein n=1 Tax=Stigmatella ashevillensis TaxID=2995309 RepID=A0ABT5DDP0_9BACT|nr:hypothetical protein [Stigmatella ashevillena]MDC0710898.1 hypothetical protein [Stigmatella ashevillena]
MARQADVAQFRDELIQAFERGDEQQARTRVLQLGIDAPLIRTVLDAMLADSFGLSRQAAVFGLGVLGGTASVNRLEEQLSIEEAREDYDGEAVIEDIIRALSNIAEPSARAVLVRRLEIMAAGTPERSEVSLMARSLWRHRHPELIPPVRRSLEQLSLPAPHGMHGLLILLEDSPEALGVWAKDPEVPVAYKTRVLVILEEDVPAAWDSLISAFISTARTLSAQMMAPEVEDYCERLLSLLLSDKSRFVKAQREEVRKELRLLARNMIAVDPVQPSLRAATLLGLVGSPEDAAFLLENCPSDPIFAKVFKDAAASVASEQP